jgi:hypothetical protein
MSGTISSREDGPGGSRPERDEGEESGQSHQSDPLAHIGRWKRGGSRERGGDRRFKRQERDEESEGESEGSGDGGETSSSDETAGSWSSSPSSNGDKGADRPRKRLREEDTPWFRKEKESRRSLSRSCNQSAELLKRYARNVPKVKRWISYSVSAPSGFPSLEWENLLKGKPVSLDVVHSSFFHVVAVRENRGRIGDHEISLGHTEPSRKVLTSGDWTAAWNSVVKAASFLFPHRRDELDAYGEFIQGEFTARQADAHWKVIRFDQSIRNEVGGGTKLLLTDFHRFDRHPSYTPPPKPSHPFEPEKLDRSEILSLRLYMAWRQTNGTVRAYNEHRAVLQEACDPDILSLYMVRKLVLKLSRLEPQKIDMHQQKPQRVRGVGGRVRAQIVCSVATPCHKVHTIGY